MSQDKPVIGFIGLGLMGQAFTRHLCETGYSVIGYDLAAEKIAAAAEHGVEAAASPAELTARAELVLLCVTSTDAVRQAVWLYNHRRPHGKLANQFPMTVHAAA